MKQKNHKDIQRYCSLLFKYRPRTEREIRIRCAEKGFDAEEIEEMIEQLYELKMLDDLRFAKMYIEDGLRLKTKGPMLLGIELAKLGISKEQIHDAIDEISEEEIDTILKSDFERNGVKNPDKWRNRMYRRGFKARRIIEMINSFKDNNLD